MCPNDQTELRDFWISAGLAPDVWPDAWQRLDRYRELIAASNQSAGLMGPEGLDSFHLKHVADSLLAIPAFPSLLAGARLLADVGSGAGLPGLVLAVALPQLHVTAIESNHRKADFIEMAVRKLDLGRRVEVVARRSRELAHEGPCVGRFDLITARAVGPAARLIRDNRRLLAPGGSMVLYKTPATVTEEMPLARRQADRHGLTIEASEELALPAGAGRRQFIRVSAPQP